MPRNVILVIGDGMGFEQIAAASYYQTGTEQGVSFHEFPFAAEVRTASADSAITDSAASATAMATGVKVANGVISRRIPGDGAPLETVIERYEQAGKASGLVTTAYVTHATPAAFGAHASSRSNLEEIGRDYFTQSRPEVVLGGGANGVTRSLAEENGYTVVTSAEELRLLLTSGLGQFSGQFGETHLPYEIDGLGELPHLSDMTEAAVAVLENDPEGFFLMVEGARIDHAGHANDLAAMVAETIELARTVDWLIDWATADGETLLLVTADHETGGLEVLENRGTGNLPAVSWSTIGHTGVNVPIFAMGPGADRVTGIMENTEIHSLLLQGLQ